MKNPGYERAQDRKVKARLRMLQHAQRVSGNVRWKQFCSGLGPAIQSCFFKGRVHRRYTGNRKPSTSPDFSPGLS